MNNESYDLYAATPCETKEQVKSIIGDKNLDVPTHIALLVAALPTTVKDYARTGDRRSGGGYKSLVCAKSPNQPSEYQKAISSEKKRLKRLGLWEPSVPRLAALPPYSTFLQFQFTLASPYLSRDDEIFHINDNPVRKDKVFKVPMVSGTNWKGNLRWTAAHLLALELGAAKEAEQLAERRFRLALLFGDEVGEGHNRGLAKYLDELDAGTARLYRQKVKSRFGQNEEQPIPNHAGYLRFYPTFFNRIGLEVINPHDRATGAGKQPIYFESVPVGASGLFSLLYVPFNGVAEEEAQVDLGLAAEAIREMMLTYGFSAKKSSGFGEAKDEVSRGKIATTAGKWAISKLSCLADEVTYVQYS